MPPSQTRTRSLIFRRCALVQNAQSRMRTTITRSTKALKKRRSANVFILPKLCTRTICYYTLDEEGDEIDWDQLSDEEFESKMEKLKVKERERITHRDIALGHYKDLAFRACDKSKSYYRPLVKYPPVDVFRAEQGGMSTQTVYLSHQKKKRVVLLRYYDEAKNDPSALQAMEGDISSFKRFDCYEEVSSDMVSVNANITSTRWVISKKMNDDGPWRSQARLVMRC
jgi:uncharacterized protein YeeX (DUF496 family)